MHDDIYFTSHYAFMGISSQLNVSLAWKILFVKQKVMFLAIDWHDIACDMTF